MDKAKQHKIAVCNDHDRLVVQHQQYVMHLLMKEQAEEKRPRSFAATMKTVSQQNLLASYAY